MLNPPPIGIGSLAAVLRQDGHDLDLFDTTFYPTFSQTSDKAKEINLQVRPFNFGDRNVKTKKNNMQKDLKEKVESFCPDLIAISILEPTFVQSITILDALKEYDMPIIAGGVFPTFAPELVLSHPAVNIVCIGEGEYALRDICRRMKHKEDILNEPNLCYKNDSLIIKNPLRELTKLDNLPIPDYDLFEPDRFYRPMAGNIYRALPIETNRGCPFHCSFCNSPAQAQLYRQNGTGNFFRKKSIARIYSEIEHLRGKYDIEYIYFTSDTFLSMSDSEFDQFIEMYDTIQLPFWIQTRPETIDKNRPVSLKEIGCHRMSMGIEHGNYKFRKTVLKKNISNESIIQACNDIFEAGIPLTINNIIGFPGETRELVFDTIQLNRQLKFDTSNAYVFAPFHGTQLHKTCIENGLIPKQKTARNLTIDAVLDMPQLSKMEIEGLRRTFALYARLPREYWPKIKIAEGEGDESEKAFEELRKVYIEEYFN